MTFKDFADWAGGQAKAGRLIGANKLRAHRLYHGAQLKPDEASKMEAASGGLFQREALIFGPAHLPAPPNLTRHKPARNPAERKHTPADANDHGDVRRGGTD